MKKTAIRATRGDKWFYAFDYFFMTLFLLIVAYPLVYIISCSFSEPVNVITGRVWLLPKGFSLIGYEAVFKYESILTGYLNSIYYTVLGTFINVVMTLMMAFPLTRKELMLRNPISKVVVFTMIFSAGMIPNYILIKNLGLLDTVWALVLPGAISAYNLMVTRTFIATSIPEEMFEAAKIDGSDYFHYLCKIVLPLSKQVIAVITLFYAVTHWNGYFQAMLYINTAAKQPLQLVLRAILVNNQVDSEVFSGAASDINTQNLYEVLKYAVIVVASLPLMILYPFVQKYFVRGVMIGSVKG